MLLRSGVACALVLVAAHSARADGGSVGKPQARASDLGEVVELARQYLGAADPEVKARLSKQLAQHDGDWNRVVDALRPKPAGDVKAGCYEEEHFTDPQLREEHPDDLLYFVVPNCYRPERPTGCFIIAG